MRTSEVAREAQTCRGAQAGETSVLNASFLPTVLTRRVDQEWFLERYHPKTEESKRYTKIKWVDSESAEFAKQLRANPRQFIASASLDPISEVFSFFFHDVVFSRTAQWLQRVLVVSSALSPPSTAAVVYHE